MTQSTTGQERYHRWFMAGMMLMMGSLAASTLAAATRVSLFHYLSYGGKIGPVLVAWAAWRSVRTSQEGLRVLRPYFRLWWILMALWFLIMCVVGPTHQAMHRYFFVPDVLTVSTFLAAIVFGARLGNWETIDRAYLLIIAVAIPIVLFGLSGIHGVARVHAVGSLAYQTERMAEPAVFLLLTLDLRRRRSRRLLIMVAYAVYVFAQILFQKRAPSVRAGSFLIAYYFIAPMVRGNVPFARLTAQRYGLMFLAAMAFGMLTFLSAVDVGESATLLRDRFEQAGMDTYRQDEVRILWGHMDTKERIIGKGMGGYFKGLSLPTAQMELGGQRLDIQASNHIGAFWSIFKGGLIFFFLLNLGYVGILLGVGRAMSNPILFACYFYVFIHISFQLIETLWGGANLIHVALVGACIGRLASSQKEAVAEPAPSDSQRTVPMARPRHAAAQTSA